MDEGDVGSSAGADLLARALKFRESAALLAAVRLDLFEKVGDGARADEIAGDRMDSSAVERLCRALVTLNLLEREKDVYVRTPEARTFLTDEGERDLRPILRHFHEVYKMWADLPEVVEKGQENYSFRDETEETFSPEFLEGMESRAIFDKEQVATVVSEHLDGGRLLDLGGGSGVYSREILKHSPGSRGVLADLEDVIGEAEKYIRRDGLEDRLTTRDIDLTSDENYGRNFDLVLLSSVLHMFGPETARKIVQRSFDALEPGGTIVIRDYVLEDNGLQPQDGVLFDIMMLLAREDGQSFTESQLESFLEESGFESPERVPLSGVTDDLLVASKPTD